MRLGRLAQTPVAVIQNPYPRYGTWSDTPMGPYQYGMPQQQAQTQPVTTQSSTTTSTGTVIEYLPGAVAPYSTPYGGGKSVDLRITPGQSTSGATALREAEQQMEQYRQALQESVAGSYPLTEYVASGSPAAYPMYASSSSPAEEAVATAQMQQMAPVPVLAAPASEGLGSKLIWVVVAGVAAYLFTRGSHKESSRG